MDIVAWNRHKLIMIEAKFHNEFGLKSDLKVALYVKARFDDLSVPTFVFGGEKPRKLDEGVLITNTKFSEQAIKYGQCAGLKMIGWNYPSKGNLHQIIEESGLHPSTCLSTLSNVHKRALLDKGVILCKDIKNESNLLREIGMTNQKIGEVMDEISNVCIT
jgi:hypothetical protein